MLLWWIFQRRIKEYGGEIKNHAAHASYDLPETKTEMLRDAPLAGIMYDKSLDPDIRSLRQLILYGLKGISAYGLLATRCFACSNAFFILAVEKTDRSV